MQDLQGNTLTKNLQLNPKFKEVEEALDSGKQPKVDLGIIKINEKQEAKTVQAIEKEGDSDFDINDSSKVDPSVGAGKKLLKSADMVKE